MMKAMTAAMRLAGAATMAQAATPAPAKVVYIHAGALLYKPGSAPRGPSTIVVRDGKVAEVRNGYAAPEAGAAFIAFMRDPAHRAAWAHGGFDAPAGH